MKQRFPGVLLAIVDLISIRPALATESLPLWEVGLGAGLVSFPAYRGSDQQHTRALPVPYLAYRGDFIRADRDGIRGVFFDSDRVEINVSLSASLPVDSNGNRARRGMSDLRPTVEIGPSFAVGLWKSSDQRARVDLRMPVRAALGIGGGIRHIGTVFAPSLNLDVRNAFGRRNWNLGFLAGPIYGDARFHRHFYSVDVADALPDRPHYRINAGYGGAQLVAALSKRFERFWVGGFVRYDDLHGAVFEDSPLVRRKNAWAAGIGIAWIVGQSSRKVPVGD